MKTLVIIPSRLTAMRLPGKPLLKINGLSIISHVFRRAIEANIGDVIVKVDPRYFRPAEVETLLGNPAKAKEKLGWVPEITVEEMCSEMVANDLESAKRHALLKLHGHDVSVALEN